MIKTTPKGNNSGFTLIELLVTITIIGMLATIGLISYRGITARGRDSQRISDARNIVTVLEIFKTSTGKYPDAGQSDWNTNSSKSQPWITGLDLTNFKDNKVPVDPKIPASSVYYYYYRTNLDQSDYCLQVSQETNAENSAYYRNKWGASGGAWRLRFGPYGANAGLCNTLLNDSP